MSKNDGGSAMTLDLESLRGHTPGPWVVNFRADGSCYISMGDPIKGPHKQFDLLLEAGNFNDEADARLISAAPELLAELTARRARDAAVEALFAAAEGAYYRGLMVGEDCAWALAKLQREGVYKPMCADGKPSNADADRDEKTIQSCRGALKAALTLFAGDKT